MTAWGVEKKPGKCMHPNARAGGPWLYGVRRVFCPDCATMLQTPSDEMDEIMIALSRPTALLRNKPRAVRPDLHGWVTARAKTPSPPECRAATIVEDAMRSAFGDGSKREHQCPQPYRILVGTVEGHPGIRRLLTAGRLRLEADGLGFDGFLVQTIGPAGGTGLETIVVAGGNPRGTLYGAIALAQALQEGQNLAGLCLREEPATRLRGGYCEGANESLIPEITTSGYRPTEPELLALAARRANLLLLRENWCVNPYIRWKYLPGVPVPPPLVEKAILELREDVELASQFGFILVFHLSMACPSWADEALLKRHPGLKARVDTTRHEPWYTHLRRYNPAHRAFRKMLAAEVQELFELYPELDGLYSWHGYDGAPLGDDRPGSDLNAFSDRLIDAHLIRYNCMKQAKPGALYIVDHSGADLYRKLLEDGLPDDVIFTSWSHTPSQDLLPHGWVPDPYAASGPRFLPQFSSHAEGHVCGFMPVFDLEHLRIEMQQFRHAGTAGVFNHHPFIAASFADPERFVDISEPYHESVLSWAWRMEGSHPGDETKRWARARFPSAWKDVAEAYTHLASIKETFVPRQALLDGFIFGWSQPFDWDLLNPEAGWEMKYPGVCNGMLGGVQTPYAYPPRGDSAYVWDGSLRGTPITRENLGIWLARFDAPARAEKAIAAVRRATSRMPDDYCLQHLALQFEGVRAAAEAYRLWAEAGLHHHVAVAEGSEVEMDRVRALLLRCLAWTYAQLVAPTNMSINWVRWGTRMFRDEQCRTVASKLAAVGDTRWLVTSAYPWSDLLDLWGDTSFPLGWKQVQSDGQSYMPLSLKGAASWPLRQPVNDVPDGFYKDPHVPDPPAKVTFEGIPAGDQSFFGVPFSLPDSSGCIVGVGPAAFGLGREASLQVGRRCSAVALLVCAVGRELPRNSVVDLVFQYRGGQQASAPVRYRCETTHYAFPEITPSAGVAWIEHSNDPMVYHQYRVTGFNFCQILNPMPQRQVEQILIRCSSQRAGALVFGVTTII